MEVMDVEKSAKDNWCDSLIFNTGSSLLIDSLEASVDCSAFLKT